MEEKLLEWADKLESLTVEYAPQAWEMALGVARVEAAAHLLSGLVALAVSLCIVVVLVKMDKKKDHNGNWDFDVSILVTTSSAFAFVVGMCAAALLLDLWNWVGLFRPELYLAKTALGL